MAQPPPAAFAPRFRSWLLRPLAFLWHCLAFASYLLGPLALTALVLQFTPVPVRLLSRLATPPTTERFVPDCMGESAPAAILVYAGSGIPGESGLNRTWQAADAAQLYPGIPLLLAIPSPSPDEPSPAARAYLRELSLHGVEAHRIHLVTSGADTYSQSAAAVEKLEALLPAGAPVLVVTSPEHMYRAVGCLRRHGLQNPLWAAPAYSKSLDDPHPAPAEMRISPETLDPVRVSAESGAPADDPNALAARNRLADRVRQNLRASSLVLDEALSIFAYRFRGWF